VGRSHRPLTATLATHTGPVLGVAFYRDARTLASANGDRPVRLLDAATGQTTATPAA
jgi:WD40 repeat protein